MCVHDVCIQQLLSLGLKFPIFSKHSSYTQILYSLDFQKIPRLGFPRGLGIGVTLECKALVLVFHTVPQRALKARDGDTVF